MEKFFKKVAPKEFKEKQEYKKDINLLQIVSQKYPETGEDYALQLWHKTYHDSFAKCTEKVMDYDMETAHLTINAQHYVVNIRTGKIVAV